MTVKGDALDKSLYVNVLLFMVIQALSGQICAFMVRSLSVNMTTASQSQVSTYG